MFGLFALPIVIMAGYLITKKYNTQAVLFVAGLLMCLLGVLHGNHELLPKGVKSSGATSVDLFLMIKAISSSTVAGLGLIIMTIGGFSKYMNHIGAANAMVNISVKPLSCIKNQYVILALTYIIGQILNIFIPSAVGLSLLLLVALYPTLIKVGCNPVAAVSVLATTGCLDLGPASITANKASEVIKIDAATYFITYQLPIAVIVMITIAILHYFSQRYFDRKDALNNKVATLNVEEKEQRKVPAWFAIMPILPLALLLVFSKFCVTSIKIDVVTAMLISLFVAMLADYCCTWNFKEVAKSLKIFFDGMGSSFASVVSLIIAAQVFVVGLKTVGFISLLLGTAHSLGFGALAMTIILVAIIGVTTILSGSGNAAFYSFASLSPDVAKHVGTSTVVIALPMQFSAGLFRSFSPVAAVVIACAGVANVSPVEVAKRTAIPMIGGVIVTIVATMILH